MALDFPANPVNGQVYDNFYYDSFMGTWRAQGSGLALNTFVNPSITGGTISGLSTDLAISDGGTGASTAADALVNFGLTATASEINYTDGVTSNIQTQLNGKAASSHTHAATDLVSGKVPYSTLPAGSVVQVQHAQTSWWQGITAHDIVGIGDLSISFTPRFSNSKILLQAMINSSGTYVATFGFLKNGGYLSGVTNTNSQGSVATTYWTDTGTSYMTNTFISYMDTPNTTSAITYQAAACSGWSGSAYYMTINDRGDGTMRSVSTLTIMEIAQ